MRSNRIGDESFERMLRKCLRGVERDGVLSAAKHAGILKNPVNCGGENDSRPGRGRKEGESMGKIFLLMLMLMIILNA